MKKIFFFIIFVCITGILASFIIDVIWSMMKDQNSVIRLLGYLLAIALATGCLLLWYFSLKYYR